MKILFYNYGNGEAFSIGYLSSYLKLNGHKTELIAEPNLDIFLKTNLLKKINFKKRLKDRKSPNRLIHILSLMCVDPSRTLIKAKEVFGMIKIF